MMRIDDVVSDLEVDVRNFKLEVGECRVVGYLLCQLRNGSLLWS
jgi:hypothetical protein